MTDLLALLLALGTGTEHPAPEQAPADSLEDALSRRQIPPDSGQVDSPWQTNPAEKEPASSAPAQNQQASQGEREPPQEEEWADQSHGAVPAPPLPSTAQALAEQLAVHLADLTQEGQRLPADTAPDLLPTEPPAFEPESPAPHRTDSPKETAPAGESPPLADHEATPSASLAHRWQLLRQAAEALPTLTEAVEQGAVEGSLPGGELSAAWEPVHVPLEAALKEAQASEPQAVTAAQQLAATLEALQWSQATAAVWSALQATEPTAAAGGISHQAAETLAEGTRSALRQGDWAVNNGLPPLERVILKEVGGQGDGGLSLAHLDRMMERDARRYDNGFTLY